jgi:hypothetical protein
MPQDNSMKKEEAKAVEQPVAILSKVPTIK